MPFPKGFWHLRTRGKTFCSGCTIIPSGAGLAGSLQVLSKGMDARLPSRAGSNPGKGVRCLMCVFDEIFHWFGEDTGGQAHGNRKQEEPGNPKANQPHSP